MTQGFQSALSKAQDLYLPQIVNTIENNDMQFTDYQKQCVMGAVSQIYDLLQAKGKTFSDVEQSTMTEALTLTASLQLNPAAQPAEIYYILRNKKVGYGQNTQWITEVEPGIEGDGNDSLLARFGRDVKTVHKFWEVRSKDEFSYPAFNGLEMTPPQWKPTGKGRVEKVVYPITKTNGDVDFLISEREDVSINLKAHIRNNMMNETFGIAKSRYDATPEQIKQINDKKDEILARMEGRSLDDMLADEELAKYISPAWKDNSESMIVRKMRNNVVKKYPKNFENAFIARSYSQADEEVRSVRRTVNEEANQELLDFDEPTPEPEVTEREDVQEVEVTRAETPNEDDENLITNDELEELMKSTAAEKEPEQSSVLDMEPGF